MTIPVYIIETQHLQHANYNHRLFKIVATRQSDGVSTVISYVRGSLYVLLTILVHLYSIIGLYKRLFVIGSFNILTNNVLKYKGTYREKTEGGGPRTSNTVHITVRSSEDAASVRHKYVLYSIILCFINAVAVLQYRQGHLAFLPIFPPINIPCITSLT